MDGSLGSESRIPSIVFLAVNGLPLVGPSCSLGKTGTASLLCEKGEVSMSEVKYYGRLKETRKYVHWLAVGLLFGSNCSMSLIS